jgi:small conductance mechanosensitive channel
MSGALANHGINILYVLVIFFVGSKIARIAANLLVKAMTKGNVDKTLTRFTGNAVRWVLLILLGIACLGVFGIETTSFAALIGAAGLAVGLAFQGTLSSVAAGVMLLVLRPFKVDDYVTVAGQTGTIVEVGLFGISMDTPQGVRVVIPNAEAWGATLSNFTHNSERRVEIDVGVDYGADIDEVRAILEAAVKTVTEGTTREGEVFLAGLGGSSVDWQVRTFCHNDNYWPVWQATIRATKMALDAANISIPFPQMDVHLDKAA